MADSHDPRTPDREPPHARVDAEAAPYPPRRPDDGVVLVTGSARGIGLAVARRLRERGARVHVVWRTPGERAEALTGEFGERAHRADLADPLAARELVAAVLEREGRLDRVVHAVGDFAVGRLDEFDARRVGALFESNLTTALHLIDAGREPVRAAAGAWVFFGVAGLGGARARRRTAAYAAAKAALASLVRSFAVEEAAHGVRANLVSPGLVPHAGAHPDTAVPGTAEKVPLGRAGTPEEVAQAVCWLLSDAAAYVTGQDLEVAGGYAL